jgi:hypothetical protein
MSLFDLTPLGAALRERGVGAKDRDRAVSWWLMSKPGETMLLVRYDGPHLLIDSDGNVTERGD